MTKRLPSLDARAAMPGRIPTDAVTLHRAAHALFYSPAPAGLRTLSVGAMRGQAKRAAQREAHNRVLDVRDAVTSHVASQRQADAVMFRIAGRGPDRDPRTRRTAYVALIVAAEDKAAAALVVAECLWAPLREVGWLDAYNERMAADARLFDHRPLVSEATGNVTTHYLATLRMTPDQRADLAAASKPASLVIVDLPVPLAEQDRARQMLASVMALGGLKPRADEPARER